MRGALRNSRVVTENKNGSNVVTSRTRVDYDYTSTGIRSLSIDWNDANLNNSFATSERTGSVEYLVDSTNHTGYAQTMGPSFANEDVVYGPTAKKTSRWVVDDRYGIQ